MAIHLHNSGPEFCFVDVDFTEERNFDLLKIGYFVDGPTLYCLFFRRDKQLESDLFCDSCYRLHSLQGMIAACVAVHHTTCNYVRTFDRVPGSGFVSCLCALFHYIYTCKVSSCYLAEIALPPMAFLLFFPQFLMTTHLRCHFEGYGFGLKSIWQLVFKNSYNNAISD